MTPPAATPSHRVVILGASNVSRSIGTIVGRARQFCPGELEILIAAGHGRSYGVWSSVLGRSLPGIRDCGLWEALACLPERPTSALVTDIGNDLLYEQPPKQIAGWVESCLVRLTAVGARTVVTELPLLNLVRLSAARFQFFRRLFAPRCRLTQVELSARARQLNELVLQLAANMELSIVAPRREWYGLDPIHIQYRRARRAWGEVLAPWRHDAPDVALPRSLSVALYLRSLLPAERRLGGRLQCRAQPVGKLADGTTIALY